MTEQYRWWEYAIRAMAIVAVTVWYGTLFLLRRMLGAAPTLTYRIFPQWARAVLRAAGVELQVKGSEMLDREGGRYVFVANHASLFDIPVLLVASPLPVRILYKRELERVPFLGWRCALRRSSPLNGNGGNRRGRRSMLHLIRSRAMLQRCLCFRKARVALMGRSVISVGVPLCLRSSRSVRSFRLRLWVQQRSSRAARCGFPVGRYASNSFRQ